MKQKINDKQKIKELIEALKNSESNLKNIIEKKDNIILENGKLSECNRSLTLKINSLELTNSSLQSNFERMRTDNMYQEGYIKGLKEEIKLLTILITGGEWKDINVKESNEINPIRNFPDCSRYNNN